MNQSHARQRGEALPLVVLLLLLAALFIASVAVYPDLPERIPQHFGIDGTPDRWVDRSWLSWLLVPIVATAVAGFVMLITQIMPRDLRYLNLPDKARLLALPRERQAEIGRAVRAMLRWIAVVVAAMFCGIQYDVWRAASGTGSAAIGALSIGLIAAVPLMVVVLMARIRRIARDEGVEVS